MVNYLCISNLIYSCLFSGRRAAEIELKNKLDCALLYVLSLLVK
jgi:hypothetical protein